MKEKSRTQTEVAQRVAQHYITKIDKWFIYKELYVEGQVYSIRFEYMPIEEYLNIKKETTI